MIEIRVIAISAWKTRVGAKQRSTTGERAARAAHFARLTRTHSRWDAGTLFLMLLGAGPTAWGEMEYGGDRSGRELQRAIARMNTDSMP